MYTHRNRLNTLLGNELSTFPQTIIYYLLYVRVYLTQHLSSLSVPAHPKAQVVQTHLPRKNCFSNYIPTINRCKK